jgi:hypothetical protein
MITSKSIAAEELEIRMKGRIAELEKPNKELRARLLEHTLRRSHEQIGRKIRIHIAPGKRVLL